MDRTHWLKRLATLPKNQDSKPLSMLDCSDMETLAIRGDDATDFLQGQLTCSVDDLPGSSIARLGALCNAKGRVIATFIISHQNNHYLLTLPSQMATICEQALQPYILRSRVQINNVTQHIGHAGIVGTHPVLSTMFSHIPNACGHAAEAAHWPDMRLTKMSNNPLIFHIHGSWNALEALWKTCQSYSSWDTTGMCHLARIYAGLVSITPATSELMTAHALGLDKVGAIDFNKGCYRGQEIIARTEYQGQNKRHLSYWLSPTVCDPADPITNAAQEALGQVITCIPFEDDNYLVQAVVHERALEKPLTIGPHTIQPHNMQTIYDDA